MVDPEKVDFAREMAEASATVIRPYFDRPDLEVDQKDDATPVTEADRRAEEILRERILARYPEHGIIGEEFGAENEDAEFVWTLDPIDGTISFVSGCPLFGTLIGLLHEGAPVLGLIHQPVTGQLCLGTGDRTTLNDRPVRVRAVAGLSEATMLVTDVHNVERYRDRRRFDRLVDEVRLFRTWGDCYGYLLVASGRADVMLDPIMHTWDIVPLVPIIRGAGGAITSWDGSDPLAADSCVAAAPGLHAAVVERLNAQPQSEEER